MDGFDTVSTAVILILHVRVCCVNGALPGGIYVFTGGLAFRYVLIGVLQCYDPFVLWFLHVFYPYIHTAARVKFGMPLQVTDTVLPTIIPFIMYTGPENIFWVIVPQLHAHHVSGRWLHEQPVHQIWALAMV